MKQEPKEKIKQYTEDIETFENAVKEIDILPAASSGESSAHALGFVLLVFSPQGAGYLPTGFA